MGTSPSKKITARDRKHIKQLVLRMQYNAEQFLIKGTEYIRSVDGRLCKHFNWHKGRIRIVDSRRDPVLQAGLYSQGRMWDEINRKWLRDENNGNIVTWIMGSQHLAGKAFDIAIFIGRIPYWPDPKIRQNKLVWQGLHEIAEYNGLKTIGLRDAGHLEI